MGTAQLDRTTGRFILSGRSGDSLLWPRMNYPCLVVSPQSSGRGWNADVLAALLDELVAKYRVDTERIYLTGLSMGGSGTWSLAAAYSDQEKSGLQIESQPGRNEYIFELRD